MAEMISSLSLEEDNSSRLGWIRNSAKNKNISKYLYDVAAPNESPSGNRGRDNLPDIRDENAPN
jgi:hypothetical protein